MPTLATFIPHSTESPSQCSEAREILKSTQIRMEEVKLFQFSDDMTLHIKNSKGSTRKLLESMNSVMLQDTKAIDKNLYTNNEISEKKDNLIYNNIKITTYLGLSLIKEVKHLYIKTRRH